MEKKSSSPVVSFLPGKSLALCIIAGNVENYIERFIKSFQQLTPHIYVVRAVGSQTPDRTLELARGLGAKTAVYENTHPEWPHVDDFGAARQMAFDMGAADGHAFLMWADTDDVIDAASAQRVHEVLRTTEVDCLFMPYRLANNGLAPLRERIIRTGTYRWQDPIHETLRAVIENPRAYQLADAEVTHLPGQQRHDKPNERNIRILESLRNSDGEMLPRWCFYLCQEYEVTGRQDDAVKTALAGIKGWQADRASLQTCEAYELYLMLGRWATDPNAKLALFREAMVLEPWRREALAMQSAT